MKLKADSKHSQHCRCLQGLVGWWMVRSGLQVGLGARGGQMHG